MRKILYVFDRYFCCNKYTKKDAAVYFRHRHYISLLENFYYTTFIKELLVGACFKNDKSSVKIVQFFKTSWYSE